MSKFKRWIKKHIDKKSIVIAGLVCLILAYDSGVVQSGKLANVSNLSGYSYNFSELTQSNKSNKTDVIYSQEATPCEQVMGGYSVEVTDLYIEEVPYWSKVDSYDYESYWEPHDVKINTVVFKITNLCSEPISLYGTRLQITDNEGSYAILPSTGRYGFEGLDLSGTELEGYLQHQLKVTLQPNGKATFRVPFGVVDKSKNPVFTVGIETNIEDSRNYEIIKLGLPDAVPHVKQTVVKVK